MKLPKQGWTGFLKLQGADFLTWIANNGILYKKFDGLATAFRTVLVDWQVRTSEDADAVWKAVPLVLKCLNDSATYAKPGVSSAYAWLYLLDRYVRTWIALERLVATNCLPMAKYGVRTLDVGSGPGPSAFAVHDFYAAMTEFSELIENPMWRQPAYVTCVERDGSTNHLRHILAEIIYKQSQQESKNVLAIAGSYPDFSEILPSRKRSDSFESLRNEIDTYFNEVVGEWDSEPRYSADEAHDIAQSLHRYRFFIFSNFLTTVKTVTCFRPNLVDILSDAHPGSVLIVLGGKEEEYPQIYRCVDRLARPAGFQLMGISGDEVSSADSVLGERIFEEGRLIYEYLQCLAPNSDDSTKPVRSYFEKSRSSGSSGSKLQVYRKYSHVPR